MKTGPALAACVALAVGAHAALLVQRPPGGMHATAAVGSAVSVRMQPVAEPINEPAAQVAADPELAATPAADEAAAQDVAPVAAMSAEPAPEFTGGTPTIGFPDALLPEGGGAVRAYLLLDAEGAAQSVSTAAPPQLPPAFQRIAEAGLKQARLQAGGATAYCLLIRFDTDAMEARLAWLPGVARDAARCLAGALPAPRELVAPEPAAHQPQLEP